MEMNFPPLKKMDIKLNEKYNQKKGISPQLAAGSILWNSKLYPGHVGAQELQPGYGR